MALSCFQLTEFGIEGQITLTGANDLVKICRSDDGVLMLVCDDEGRAMDPALPVPANFAVAGTILGFVLDIGIQRIKTLSLGSGYYFGSELKPAQSKRVVAQGDYDEGCLLGSEHRSTPPTNPPTALSPRTPSAASTYSTLTTVRGCSIQISSRKATSL